MNTTTIMQPPQLSKGRLILLGTSSVILCLSFIMSVFAPFPIALAVILYGRVLGILTGLAGLIATFAFAQLLYKDFTLFGFYACVLIFGLGIAELVLRNKNPIRGIVAFGLGFIVLLAGSGALFLKSRNLSAEQTIIQWMDLNKDKIEQQKKIIEQSAEKDSIQVLQLLDRPDLLAKEVIESFPAYLFMGVFLMLWFNMFLALKSRRLLLSAQDYPYSEKNLLNFKVPFALVILLVVGFVLAIWGNEMGTLNWEPVGLTIIKCLGIFYFFQGFGVMSDLLTFLGIMGFFRSIMVMIVILMANYLIAAAGLFDNWFDFRKYFVKRKTDSE